MINSVIFPARKNDMRIDITEQIYRDIYFDMIIHSSLLKLHAIKRAYDTLLPRQRIYL